MPTDRPTDPIFWAKMMLTEHICERHLRHCSFQKHEFVLQFLFSANKILCKS